MENCGCFNHGGIPLINTTKIQWKTAALDVLRCQMQLLLAKPVAVWIQQIRTFGVISWYLLISPDRFCPACVDQITQLRFFNIQYWPWICRNARSCCMTWFMPSKQSQFWNYLFLHCEFWVCSSWLMGHSSTVSSQLVARSIIISPMAKELQKKGKDKAAMEPAKCLVFPGIFSTPGFFEAQQSARRSKVFFWLQTYCMMCLWSKMFGCLDVEGILYGV